MPVFKDFSDLAKLIDAEMPTNKTSKCTSTIEFGDDFGDNTTTFRCRLPKGHDGNHAETGIQYGQTYKIEWMDAE